MILNVYVGQAQTDFPYKQPDDAILGLADYKPAPVIRMKHDAFIDMTVLDVKTGEEKKVIGLPTNPLLSNHIWSNDQSKMAFTNTVENGYELWYLDLKSLTCKKLSQPVINAAVSNVLLWTKDDQKILATTNVPDRKTLTDSRMSIPTGPTISENDGKKAQNRTYQDLLKNAVDEDNFEILATSEITAFSLNGQQSLFKSAAMYGSMNFSPDGNYLLTYELQKPFSYIVTYDRFPADINLSDKTGKFIKTYHQYPLTEDLPKGFMAVRKGKRSIQWRADKPATLYWVEALDGGDPAIVFNPSDSTQAPRLFNQRNSQDNYADLGDFVTKRNQFQLNTLDLTDDNLYMIGEGFTPEGKFPFIDQYKISDFTKKRWYQCKETNRLEQIISAIDIKKGQFLTRLESKTSYQKSQK